MTLGEFTSHLPGYVGLLLHTKDRSWHLPAGSVINHKELVEAQVVQATPIAPYAMEISIELKEENQ